MVCRGNTLFIKGYRFWDERIWKGEKVWKFINQEKMSLLPKLGHEGTDHFCRNLF